MQTDATIRIDPDKLPLPSEPYRGILPFRLLDWRIFLERNLEIERLGNLISMYSAVLLYGPSGAGKSSLLNAGVIPDALRRGRAPERIRVFPQPGREIVIERIHLREDNANAEGSVDMPQYLPSQFTLADDDERVELSCDELLARLSTPSDRDLGVPLLIFDQFEELVTLFEENPKDEERFSKAREARAQIDRLIYHLLLNEPFHFKLAFAFRDDYLARLTPLFARIPNLLDQTVRLSPPQVDAVPKIVRGPFLRAEDGERGLPGHFNDELGDDLAAKITEGIRARRLSGVVNLSEVQSVCRALWRQPKLRQDLLQAADAGAVLEGIIESEAVAVLNAFLPWDRFRALALLSNLVTNEGTRDVVSEENLVAETRRNPLMLILRGDLGKLLRDLKEKTPLLRRSLSGGTAYYELASEFLISWIQKQQRAFRKKTLIVWSAIIALQSLLVVLLVVLGLSVYSKKQIAVRAKRDAEEAKHTAEVAQLAAENANTGLGIAKRQAEAARIDADNVRKKSDALIGLITSIEGEITGALEANKKTSLANDLKKQLAEYQKQYTEEVPKTGSWIDQIAQIRSKARVLMESGDSSGALQLYLQALKIAKEAIGGDNKSQDRMWVSSLLSDQANVLMSQGNLDQAKQCLFEAQKIIREFTTMLPADNRWRRESAVISSKIGTLLQAQGDSTGALKSYREGLVIAEELAKQDPDKLLWQHDLAGNIVRIGDMLVDLGNLAEAFNSYRRAFSIAEGWARLKPKDTDWQTMLVACHNRIGDVVSDQGNLTAALDSYQKAYAIIDKLAATDRSKVAWQRELGATLGKIGDSHRKQGDFVGALTFYLNSLAMRLALTKQDQGNWFWQSDLAGAYTRIGITARDQGDVEQALSSLHQAVAIWDNLAKQDPDNIAAQRGFSRAYEAMGNALRDRGELPAALKNYRDALAIREALAKYDPASSNSQADLASSYAEIGQVLLNQHDFDGALRCYRRALEIRQKLSQQDATNATWQNNTANSFAEMGDLQRLQEKFDDAITNYRAGLEIAEKLAKQDPTIAKWQADLARLSSGLAISLAKTTATDKDQSRRTLEKAVNIFWQLRDRQALTAEQEKWLDEAQNFSSKALDMIINFVGIDQPSKWPGGSSGINLGILYDLGGVTPEQFENDWKNHLTRDQINRLKRVVGIWGEPARRRAGDFTDVNISRNAAIDVFRRATLPVYQTRTAQVFPGYEKLPLDAQGVLVALVINRGTSLEGEGRQEMRAIRDLISSGDLRAIAAQIRAMKRLWVGKGLDGLIAQREAEALLVESAIPH